MGIITIEKANHLYWLGRYAERMTGTIRNYMICYDKLIDIDPKAYIDFCSRLSVPYEVYTDGDDFAERFVYDETLPDSLVSAIRMAFDNAVVLREEITGETLAYIDLARHILEASEHGTLMLELQTVLDDINAFWGSAADTMDEISRAIMKCGKQAEKLDILCRFGISGEMREREHARLTHRLHSLAKSLDMTVLEEEANALAASVSDEELIAHIVKITDCFAIRQEL